MSTTPYATVAICVARAEVRIRGLVNLADSDDLTTNAAFIGAIAAANQLIDSYVGQRYSLPLATPPDHLVSMAVDLVIWELSKRRPDTFGGDADRAAHDDAIRYLEGLAQSKLGLDLSEQDDTITPKTEASSFTPGTTKVEGGQQLQDQSWYPNGY